MILRPDATALYYFNVGESANAYGFLGAHQVEDGWRFLVWAPNASAVYLAGSFNEFHPDELPMSQIENTGVFQITVQHAKKGDLYKYVIHAPNGSVLWRADPYAFRCEKLPGTASMVWGLPTYEWKDAAYYANRSGRDIYKEPMNIYEVHLGSFRSSLSYRELAHELIPYAVEMGYTHLEVMPICEYPLDASWGYQTTGYYAATHRYGEPEDLMYLIDVAHQHGLGVLLDWVPSHYPRDEQGLRLYDGTPLYEDADKRRAEQPQWGTLQFDYARPQVQSFLLSNAYFWLKEFHFDGLRVDAVSAILYLDYGRNPGEWVPNIYGERENLDAIAFFKKLTTRIRSDWPDGGRILIAEESTAFPNVTKPAEHGGLGFHFKWNMGWMNDSLSYMQMDSLFRKWHHNKLTFSLCYAFSEHYVLPFSHDEVVHGKRSLLDKMPGDYWQKFAQLRLLFAYQFAHPGKKLNFMGSEFGQFIEWKFDAGLDWLLLDYPMHKSMQAFTKRLNHFYKDTPALYQRDDDWGGFGWVSVNDHTHSIAAFLRWDEDGGALLCAFNFTPVPWKEYVLNLPVTGILREVLSSDEPCFGGTGDWRNEAPIAGDRAHIKLPPFGAVFFSLQKEEFVIGQACGK